MKVDNEIERMLCVDSILSFKFLDIVLDELDAILKTFFKICSRVVLRSFMRESMIFFTNHSMFLFISILDEDFFIRLCKNLSSFKCNSHE